MLWFKQNTENSSNIIVSDLNLLFFFDYFVVIFLMLRTRVLAILKVR